MRLTSPPKKKGGLKGYAYVNRKPNLLLGFPGIRHYQVEGRGYKVSKIAFDTVTVFLPGTISSTEHLSQRQIRRITPRNPTSGPPPQSELTIEHPQPDARNFWVRGRYQTSLKMGYPSANRNHSIIFLGSTARPAEPNGRNGKRI